MRRIYLDHNATTPLLPEVLDAMMPYLSGEHGNASSLHQEGQAARRTLEAARETIAELLKAEPDQVIFTSGGTEANNLAIRGLTRHPSGHLLRSSIEHPSVRDVFERLGQQWFSVEEIPVDAMGVVDPIILQGLLRRETRLVSIMLANNETGTLQPVEELAHEAKYHGIAFHTDAVQAVGRTSVSFRDLGVTSLSISAHKFHGPVGIGALIVERKEALQSILNGGHQEYGLRPGTEPVALAAGMARALELAIENMESETERLRKLRDYFEENLRNCLHGVIVNGPLDGRVPNTSNIRIRGMDAQAIVMALDLMGVACSTGSACSSGAVEPSHALLAMGLTRSEARSSIRFSFGRLTKLDDVKEAIRIVAKVVRKSTTYAAARVKLNE